MNNNEYTGKLIIDKRKSLSLDGVENVSAFDEGYVALETKEGKMVVEGDGLKIESLDKTSGSILLSGVISGVFYSDDGKEKGFFKKLFK